MSEETSGEVERSISETVHDECTFTNGYLAKYSEDLSEQLRKKCPLHNPHGAVEDFICFLIDKHEGDIVSEEWLQQRYADFLQNDKYSKPKPKPKPKSIKYFPGPPRSNREFS